MTDRELLESAARAAGIFMRKEDWPYSDPFDPSYLDTFYDPETNSISGTRVWHGGNGDVGGLETYTWSPLNYDDEAFRLAIDLKIDLHFERNGIADQEFIVEAFCLRDEETGGCRCLMEVLGDDPRAATRRVITRAAAAIGENVK
jgi:hypothetical protein